MLLESALAEFSIDDSSVFGSQPGTSAILWEAKSGKPRSSLSKGGGSNSIPAEIKHAYQLKLFPSRQFSGGLNGMRNKQAPSKEAPHFKASESRKLPSALDHSRSPPPLDLNLGISTATAVLKQRSLISGAGENLHHELAENQQSVKPKLQKDKSMSRPQMQQAQPPPTRVISLKGRNLAGSPGRRSLGKSSIPPVPDQNREIKKYPQQQRGKSPVLVKMEGKPSQSSKFRSGSDLTQVKKLEVPTRPAPRGTKTLDSNNVNSFRNVDSEFMYVEESPVSILERIPSPPATNSSGSSGSLVRGKRVGPGVVIQDATVPGLALARGHLPSFSSSSAQSSPRVSTSSSARYMGHCLVALQEALAVDPEKSKRFEDSFVELDTYGEGHGSRRYPTSPLGSESTDQGSPPWAGDAHSELEPEYNAMDFYTDDEDDNHSIRSSASAVSSPARSDSGSSTTSIISRPMRQSLKQPRVSVDDYSVKDKRFMSDHPSSWVEHGDDDSVCSSFSNSKRSTILNNRHQDVSWDDQQADLTSERVEEVVRGAVDGLRFTYSPVSSAFVFTRSNEGDEEASEPKFYNHHSRRDTFDSEEASRRFSMSLDYANSLCSGESLSFARGSEVTELGLSRAESWSKVARGVSFEQGYQDAVPSSFLRRAGKGPLVEENAGNNDQARELRPRGFAEGNDTRLIRKRPSKKSGMVTCLPFRSILRNFTAVGHLGPGRSRLGPSSSPRLKWTSTVNKPPY